MNLRPSVLVITALIATSLLAQVPTTPKDRAHWAEITHKLETAPLDESATVEAEAVVKQVMGAHDFHAHLCTNVLRGLRTSEYTYHAEILRLYILGATTYQVETRKTDGEGTSLYAFHSILKGYAAILRQFPDAKDRELEEMAALDAVGQLPHLIENKGCM